MIGSSKNRRAKDPKRLIPWLQERNRTFRKMSIRALNGMFAKADVKRYARGSLVQQQDIRADHAYIVTDGTMTVRVNNDGIYRELFNYQPGEMAGLLALVDQHNSPYEVYAATDAEAIRLNVKHLSQLRAAYHPTALEVMNAFMPMFVEHLRALDKRCIKLAARQSASVHGTGQTVQRSDR